MTPTRAVSILALSAAADGLEVPVAAANARACEEASARRVRLLPAPDQSAAIDPRRSATSADAVLEVANVQPLPQAATRLAVGPRVLIPDEGTVRKAACFAVGGLLLRSPSTGVPRSASDVLGLVTAPRASFRHRRRHDVRPIVGRPLLHGQTRSCA